MMSATSKSRWIRSLTYWVRLALLTVYGPATQDEATDPIEQLKRDYGRTTADRRWHRIGSS